MFDIIIKLLEFLNSELHKYSQYRGNDLSQKLHEGLLAFGIHNYHQENGTQRAKDICVPISSGLTLVIEVKSGEKYQVVCNETLPKSNHLIIANLKDIITYSFADYIITEQDRKDHQIVKEDKDRQNKSYRIAKIKGGHRHLPTDYPDFRKTTTSADEYKQHWIEQERKTKDQLKYFGTNKFIIANNEPSASNFFKKVA